MSGSDWPIHDFKTWRTKKGLTVSDVSKLLAAQGVHLGPRSIQAIEYGLRRPHGSDYFVFSRLTGGIVSAEYFANFPLRPRSDVKRPDPKRLRRIKKTA